MTIEEELGVDLEGLAERLRRELARKRVPASHAQERLWILDQLTPDSAAYHMPAIFHVQGKIDPEALQGALDLLLARHDVLRTRLTDVDGRLLQEVVADASVTLERYRAPWGRALARARTFVAKPFALEEGEVLRVALYDVADNEQLLAFCMHHIASDGVSMEVLVREIGSFYSGQSLPELALQYADYAEWQRRWLEEEGELDRQLGYWTEQLRNLEPLALPVDRPRPARASDEAAVVPVAFTPELSERVRAFARSEGTTPYVVWLSLFGAVLGRLGHQEDVAIGSPVANRQDPELESLIGFFVNTVVQRLDLSGGPSLRQLVRRTHEMALRTQEHQDAPFEKVVEALDVPRNQSSTPLFQVMLAFREGAEATLALGEARLVAVDAGARAKFDLDLSLVSGPSGTEGALTYRSTLYEATMMERVVGRLKHLAEASLDSPEKPLGELALVDAEERLTLQSWSSEDETTQEWPLESVVVRFRALARMHAERPALSFEGEVRTYAELDSTTDRIAAGLRAKGVRVGDRVALVVERGFGLLEAVWGVWKASASYVPLDPELPVDRLQMMLADARPVAVLRTSDRGGPLEGLEHVSCLSLDQIIEGGDGPPPPFDVPPSAPAYLIYTSGSTGTPKGVEVPHGGLANAARVCSELGDHGPHDMVLSFASPVFDAFVLDQLFSLLNGGCLAIAPEGVRRDLGALGSMMRRAGVTSALFPPSVWSMLEPAELPGLRVVMTGGEACPATLPARWRGKEVLNLYGPTEAAIFVTATPLEATELDATPPIGGPTSGNGALVLDERLQPVPIGVVGELYLAGRQLAHGYHRRSRLTAERFVPNPHGLDGERLYRTGDLARWRSDGRLEYIGRADQQVKLRGYRVELGEVEAQLLASPSVRSAVVRASGGQLHAYVVTDAQAFDATKLRTSVAAALPDYMVPASFTRLDQLPLTVSGKVDRKALPEPQLTQAEFRAPERETEVQLAAIWEELLGVDRVGLDDDFFQLGGHSLLATRLVARVRSDLGRELPLRVVFAESTLGAMAGATRTASTAVGLARADRSLPLLASPAQQRLWVLQALAPESSAYHMLLLLRIDGALDVDRLQASLRIVIDRHEILRTRLLEHDGKLLQEVMGTQPTRVARFAMEEEAALVHAREWMVQPFELDRGAVLRMAAYELGPSRHLVAFAMHHVASDGVSMALMASELGLAYAALEQGQTPELPVLPLQYADYAAWQRDWLTSDACAEAEGWWRGALEGAPLVLGLPTDSVRTAERGVLADVNLRWTASERDAIEELARGSRGTLFSVVLSCLGVVLGRWTGREDLLIGAPVAGRPVRELDSLIGFFMNTVPLRVRWDPADTGRSLVARTSRTMVESLQRQSVPFESLVEQLDPPRQVGMTPVVQVMLNVLPEAPPELHLGGPTTVLPSAELQAKFDLNVYVTRTAEGLEARLTYDERLFDADRMEALATQWREVLADVVARPEAPVSSLGRPAREVGAAPLPSTEAPSPLALWKAVVDERPDAVALESGARRWTHEELWSRVEAVAAELERRGVEPGEVVFLDATRTATHVVSLLGVLRAGAVAAPLPASAPRAWRERRWAMAPGALRLTGAPGEPGERVWVVDLDRLPAGTPSRALPASGDRMSLLFTSGTSGEPKGVMATHGSVGQFFEWYLARVGAATGARVPLMSGLGHDPMWRDVFAGLLSEGGALCVPEGEVEAEPEAMAEWLVAARPTLMHATPSRLAWLEPSLKAPLPAALVLGGEPLTRGPLERARRLTSGGIFGGYGATETPQLAGLWEWAGEAPARPPLGEATPGHRFRIETASGHEALPGEVGELLVETPWTAEGYWTGGTLEDLPGDAGVYRTGDRVVREPDGSVSFVERVSEGSPKVRGERVPVAEVERALEAHPSVRRATVVVRGDVLHAYLVSADGSEAVDPTLREALAEQLPAQLVPSTLTVLDELPLTPSGKVDRRALPDPEVSQALYRAPEGEAETALATIWQELLKVERVGRDDDFFALGGHSLMATRLVARVRSELQQELPLRAVFEHSTLAAMASELGGRSLVPVLAAGERPARVPASYAQARMWVLHELAPESAAYHMPALLRVDGALDSGRLETALQQLVARHEVLRTKLVERDGELVQEVRSEGSVVLEQHRMSRAEAEAHARAFVARPFALAEGEVLRAALYEVAEGEQLLAFCMHHIASDGVSMQVLVREIGALYAGEALPPLRVQYADYALWQQQWMEGEGELERQLGYWTEQLRSVEPLALPTDHPRPARASDKAGRVPVALSPELSERVRGFARTAGTTPYVVWLSLFGALLGRLGRQDDVTIGSPVANRRDPKLEPLIGLFVNTVVQRLDLSGRPSLIELVRRTHEVALRTQEHQDAPFEKVVEALDVQRDLSSTPLFQAMLTYRETAVDVVAFDTAELAPLAAEPGAKFDIDLALASGPMGTSGALTYRSTLYAHDTMERLVGYLAELAGAALRAPREPVGSLALGKVRESPIAPMQRPPKTVVEQLLERGLDTPSEPAVVGVDGGLSYGELVERARRMAGGLALAGVRPGDRVALLLERDTSLATAVWGVWLAGAAYVPMDPMMPALRLQAMAEDARPALVVASASLTGEVPLGFRWDSVEGLVEAGSDWEAGAVVPAGGRSAYVIFTSGSTGRPKGVEVTHDALAAFVAGSVAVTGLSSKDRVAALTTLAFDISLLELVAPLTVGAQVEVLPKSSSLDGRALGEALGRSTYFQATPATWHMLLESGWAGATELTALCGGEALPLALGRALRERVGTLWNMYGPTEATVWCSAERVPRAPTRIVLGPAYPGSRIAVVDEAGHPCPVDMPGELQISGPQVAVGYVQRPAATAGSFVPDPTGPPGSRAYRSGDLVRWRADGRLQFLGRLDTQLKVRGYRIEAEEVEAAFERDETVSRCVVVFRNERLSAYVVASAEARVDREELMRLVATVLPPYMVPATVTELDELPLTPSGKVDRRALPDPEVEQAAYRAPQGEAEEALAVIWRDLLEVQRVSRDDDFFALGGHSLLATRLVARARGELDLELPLRAVFEHPTLSGMAAALEGESAVPQLVAGERPARVPASYAQARMWVLHELAPESAAYHMPALLRVEGTLDPDDLDEALRQLVARHEVLRTRLVERGGELVQEVLEEGAATFERYRMSRAEAEAHARAFVARPFALAEGEVLRAALYDVAEDEQLLAFCMHHVASDGVSMQVLVRDIGALYAGESLPPLAVQYADYALWQRQWMENGGELERQLGYWVEQLQSVEPLALPTDHPRAGRASDEAGTVPVALSLALSEQVRAFARAEGTTPYVVWLSLFGAVLGHLGRQYDVTIGSPVANRRDPKLEPLIGLFVNTVVQRLDLSGRPSLRELVRRTHEVTLRTQEHQDAPFEKVVDALEVPRDLSSTPLFQAMLAYQSQARDERPVSLGPAKLTALPTEAGLQFDWLLALVPTSEGTGGVLQYRSSLYELETAEGLVARLVGLAERWLEAPEAPMPPVWRDEAERAEVGRWSESSAVPADTSLTLASVETSQMAVHAPDGERSYEELRLRASAWSQTLAARGVQAGDRVGVYLDRTAHLPEVVWGIWQLGACFVPLDRSYPRERLVGMLEDAAPAVVVTRRSWKAELPLSPSIVALEDLVEGSGGFEAREMVREAEAYLIFTSGSTGRPKGVSCTYGTLERLTGWQREATSDEARAGAVSQFAPSSFDVFVQELAVAHTSGRPLAILGEAARQDPRRLAERLEEWGVSQLFVPFVALDALVQSGAPRPTGLREVVVAGEALRVTPLMRSWFGPGCRLVNQYGPTETHVVTAYRLPSDPASWPLLPSIGRSVAGASASVLDSELRHCAVGVPGELYLGGSQVANGYRGQAGLTASRFVPDPHGEPGARMYRTGDLARWASDGTLEFLGRADFQVKVRGYRIELGEVESALERQLGAGRVVCVARGGLLHGYVVSPDPVERDAVFEALRLQLPDYMVPSTLTVLDEMPLTPSGKVDRRALPEPELELAAYRAPEGPVEFELAAIWQDLLQVDRVGRSDDFFRLGGHSLLATRLVARVRSELEQDLPLRAVFEQPTLAGMAASLGGEPSVPVLEARERPERVPASYAQSRMWVLHELAPESAAYHMPALLRVEGSLDAERLGDALQELVARHEVLRTRLVEREGELVQEVLSEGSVTLERHQMDRSEAEAHAGAFVSRPFALGKGEVLRAALYEVAEGEQLLAFCMHHIASDGVSMQVLVREIGALYAGESLAPLSVQYADYALWQREWMGGGGELERQLAYWTKQLRSVEPLALAPDYPRLAGSYESDRLSLEVAPELSERLRSFAKAVGTTPYVVWLALFGAALGRFGRQDDLTIGSPVANRRDPKLEPLIGFFVNTVVQRIDLSGRPSFRELVRRTAETALQTQEHQDAPFEKVVEALDVPRDLTTTPLFQAMLGYQEDESETLDLGDVRIQSVPAGSGAAFDLDLALVSGESGTTGTLSYRSDLHTVEAMESLVSELLMLASESLKEPDAPLSDLGPTPSAENEPPVPTSSETLVDRFEATVAAHGAGLAVIDGESRTTYRELDVLVREVASGLLGRGLVAEEPVGVMLAPGITHVATMLGVLRAGGAYLPLDPDYPMERLRFMLRDSGARLLIADTSGDVEEGVDVLSPKEVRASGSPPLPLPRLHPSQLAYLIYTSGSTGTPKAVAVGHDGACVFVRGVLERVPVERTDRILQFSALSFDVSIEELFMALSTGATLVTRPAGQMSWADLRTLCERNAVTVLDLPTAFWSELETKEGLPDSVHTVIIGGEAANPRAVESFISAFPEVRLVNMYGPTEAVVSATSQQLTAMSRAARVPIGHALPGVRARVLGAGLLPVPDRAIGELYLGGAQLARGYAGRAALTAERFVPDPYGPPGSRMYRSGDLVRRARGGALDFLGRADSQVKLRGFRVELSEVEAALERLPSVARAAATARDGRLDGYIVLRESVTAPTRDLQAALAARLPAYMVPATLTILDELPLTPSGKVDRRALPAPQVTKAVYRVPEGDAENALAIIWQDLLGVERVGRDDDFFALGGHSLLATRMAARVRVEMSRDIPLRAIFEGPTLRSVAASTTEMTRQTPIEANATVGSAESTRLALLAAGVPPAVVDALDQAQLEELMRKMSRT